MEENTAAEWVTCVKYKRDELTEERKRARLKLEGMVREEQDKNQRHVGEGQSNEEERKRGGSNEGFSYKQTVPPSGTFCICVCFLILISVC